MPLSITFSRMRDVDEDARRVAMADIDLTPSPSTEPVATVRVTGRVRAVGVKSEAGGQQLSAYAVAIVSCPTTAQKLYVTELTEADAIARAEGLAKIAEKRRPQ